MNDLYEGFIQEKRLYIPKGADELIKEDPFCLVTNFNEDGLELLVVSSKKAFMKMRNIIVNDFDRKHPKDDPAKAQRWLMSRTSMAYYKEAVYKADSSHAGLFVPLENKNIGMFGEITRSWIHIVPEQDKLIIFKPETIGNYFAKRALSAIKPAIEEDLEDAA